MSLAQGHNAMPLVRLEPATPQSRNKHYSTALPQNFVGPDLGPNYLQRLFVDNNTSRQDIQQDMMFHAQLS